MYLQSDFCSAGVVGPKRTSGGERWVLGSVIRRFRGVLIPGTFYGLEGEGGQCGPWYLPEVTLPGTEGTEGTGRPGGVAAGWCWATRENTCGAPVSLPWGVRRTSVPAPCPPTPRGSGLGPGSSPGCKWYGVFILQSQRAVPPDLWEPLAAHRASPSRSGVGSPLPKDSKATRPLLQCSQSSVGKLFFSCSQCLPGKVRSSSPRTAY